ncbi:MAG: hypothetical protein ABI566_08385 [Pseudolysinimonas sp.]
MSPLFGPSPDKVRDSGTPTPGVVTGIEITSTHDEDVDRHYAWAVEAGGTTYGIRQELMPVNGIRLGMPVTLHVDGTNAVIIWGDATLIRWKMLKTPPAAGIVDDHDLAGNKGALSRARKDGSSATVTITGLVERSIAMGLGAVIDATIRVESEARGSYDATVENVGNVPGYATHLPVVGAVLPAWESRGTFGGERVLVDWPGAAMADPGVGRETAVPRVTGGLMGKLGGLAGKMESDNAAVSQTEPEIPDYAKGFMKKFGVDPDNFK